jgi:hypothetical protein
MERGESSWRFISINTFKMNTTVKQNEKDINGNTRFLSDIKYDSFPKEFAFFNTINQKYQFCNKILNKQGLL